MLRTRDEALKTTSAARDKAFAALDRIRRTFKGKLSTQDEKLLSEGMGEVEEGLGTEAGTGNGAAQVGEHHVHVHLPGAGGSGPQDVTDEGVDPATGAGAGEEGGDLGTRLARMEAIFAKFAPLLNKLAGQGGGEEPKPSAADADIAEGEVEEDDPDAAATGDAELFSGPVSMDNPTPAATGDELVKVTRDGRTFFKTKDNKFIRDSAHMAEGFQNVLSLAEVLVPGIQVPTYDAALPATKTVDAICGLRRRALSQSYKTEDGKALIHSIYTGDLSKNLSRMTCDSIAMVFNGAAALAKVANNSNNSYRPAVRAAARDNDAPKGPQTLREINDRNRKAWNQPNNG